MSELTKSRIFVAIVLLGFIGLWVLGSMADGI